MARHDEKTSAGRAKISGGDAGHRLAEQFFVTLSTHTISVGVSQLKYVTNHSRATVL